MAVKGKCLFTGPMSSKNTENHLDYNVMKETNPEGIIGCRLRKANSTAHYGKVAMN